MQATKANSAKFKQNIDLLKGFWVVHRLAAYGEQSSSELGKQELCPQSLHRLGASEDSTGVVSDFLHSLRTLAVAATTIGEFPTPPPHHVCNSLSQFQFRNRGKGARFTPNCTGWWESIGLVFSCPTVGGE